LQAQVNELSVLVQVAVAAQLWIRRAHSSSDVQSRPLPVKPGLHAQRNDPAVSVHTPLALQSLVVDSAHSFTLTQVAGPAGAYPVMQLHENDPSVLTHTDRPAGQLCRPSSHSLRSAHWPPLNTVWNVALAGHTAQRNDPTVFRHPGPEAGHVFSVTLAHSTTSLHDVPVPVNLMKDTIAMTGNKLKKKKKKRKRRKKR
jgi:hypothetical protein